MTTLATVTISVTAGNGATQRAEREQIRWVLGHVEQAVGDGSSTSGTIIDRTGAAAATWSYSAQASS